MRNSELGTRNAERKTEPVSVSSALRVPGSALRIARKPSSPCCLCSKRWPVKQSKPELRGPRGPSNRREKVFCLMSTERTGRTMRNSELGTRNAQRRTRNSELGTRSAQRRTRNAELGTRNAVPRCCLAVSSAFRVPGSAFSVFSSALRVPGSALRIAG